MLNLITFCYSLLRFWVLVIILLFAKPKGQKVHGKGPWFALKLVRYQKFFKKKPTWNCAHLDREGSLTTDVIFLSNQCVAMFPLCIIVTVLGNMHCNRWELMGIFMQTGLSWAAKMHICLRVALRGNCIKALLFCLSG